MDLILKAAAFAREAHAGQVRKYNGRPYITHPARVAGRAAVHPLASTTMVAAAFLHDVVEDTGHPLSEIAAEFGPEVAATVGELTNPSKGSSAPRDERKRRDREHLAQVSMEAKVIKLLDRIDNLREMRGASRSFVETYCNESRALAEVVGEADAELKKELLDCIKELETER